MLKKKAVFIGGLTNGYEALKIILESKKIDLELIVTYPKKSSNIPRFKDLKKIYKKRILYYSNQKKLYKSISNINPNLIFVVGWNKLIENKILKIPNLGTIGFHPSQLPKDRGGSVVAWQIEENYKKIYLSIFYLNNKTDQGAIIDQTFKKILKSDYINNVLDKIDKMTKYLMIKNLNLILSNKVNTKKQNNKIATYRKRRDNSNSLIDWKNNVEFAYNKIRAISKPYPGAIGIINNQKYKIWKSKIINNKIINKKNLKIGEYTKHQGKIIFRLQKGYLKLVEYEKIK